ncbi:hypothetical protein H1D32_07355 [Anaerobacillus sp. CMMVII]|nr:hypothetical protein [Anaerobacillus sp. CMMVII]MCT8137577.1 hypothetical protein [Anaerobacillus sp. CMMVII]
MDHQISSIIGHYGTIPEVTDLLGVIKEWFDGFREVSWNVAWYVGIV